MDHTRAVAEGRAPSDAASIIEAPARLGADEELVAMLAQMDVEHGPPTAHDSEWAERALGLRA